MTFSPGAGAAPVKSPEVLALEKKVADRDRAINDLKTSHQAELGRLQDEQYALDDLLWNAGLDDATLLGLEANGGIQSVLEMEVQAAMGKTQGMRFSEIEFAMAAMHKANDTPLDEAHAQLVAAGSTKTKGEYTMLRIKNGLTFKEGALPSSVIGMVDNTALAE